MKTIFKSISDRISEKCPEIVIVDLDAGQLNRYDEEVSLPLPAVLLSIAITGTDEIDSSEQIANLEITARIAIDNAIGETSSVTPEQWRDKALARLDIIDSVTTALQGFSTDSITPLSRSAVSPESRGGDLLVYSLRFTSTFSESFE